MAVKLATRTAQIPQVAVFDFTITDTMVDVNGVSKAFSAAAPVMDVINLPVNSVIVGGDMVVVTVSDESGTATISVGDSGSATRYLGATTIKSAARTALVPTGYINSGGLNLRITLANQNANATAGRVRVTVHYIIDGRGGGDVQPV